MGHSCAWLPKVNDIDASQVKDNDRVICKDSDHQQERQLMADAQHTLALLRRLSLSDAALARRPNSDALR
jgi:hypothetical protein